MEQFYVLIGAGTVQLAAEYLRIQNSEAILTSPSFTSGRSENPEADSRHPMGSYLESER